MIKRKVSLPTGSARAPAPNDAPAEADEVLELFFDTGIVFHELTLPHALPDRVSSFVVVKDARQGAAGVLMRRAREDEEPDIEISALEHLGELAFRWLPVPYQLSCPFCVQIFLAPGTGGRAPRALFAIDTLARAGSSGRQLDPMLDAGRPFRALDKDELGSFFDHPETREFVRRLEREGIERALFKLAALLETLAPFLPKIRLSRIEESSAVPVSLVLDLGNSRSSALLVEAHTHGLFAIPLELRSSSNPLSTSDEAFDSRISFLPSPFDKACFTLATGDGFVVPSIARMGREALDRALETPHRYQCTLSGPKRYLWDDRSIEDDWHFALKQDGEHRPIAGRLLKYIVEEAGGLELRPDGPSAPPEPRYAPRAMMLFAIAEIVTQALAQVNSVAYRRFQGREHSPRVLERLVLTYPSAMRDEEKQIYEKLVQNAVTLVCELFGIPRERRPNALPEGGFLPFLFADEALAAQMVYVYQEIAYTFSGSMEEFEKLYGRKGEGVRIASIDIGGGTTDVMIAEYTDKLPGVGTQLCVRKLFQDGVGIAGDEVCRAIIEDIVFAEIVQQIPEPRSREAFLHLFEGGDSGYGAAWRTLRAKLVPHFWLPLARCYWAVAEGFEIPEHTPDKVYSVDDISRIFGISMDSSVILNEADRFLSRAAPGFPGLHNLMFRFDRREVERTALSVLREPLRRYADILAQFDVDLLVLAGRASALDCVRELFIEEMPVPPPRIKSMARYRVGEWYPSKWRDRGLLRDPKTTVAAGAAVLHLAETNRLSGFLLDELEDLEQNPIYGLYQEAEPHIAYENELFRNGTKSRPFVYTSEMRIGFRNVDSQEMDGSPLFEVEPTSPEALSALLDDRVLLSFELSKEGQISIESVASQRGIYDFKRDDFRLRLKTITTDRYWLDTGVFKDVVRFA